MRLRLVSVTHRPAEVDASNHAARMMRARFHVVGGPTVQELRRRYLRRTWPSCREPSGPPVWNPEIDGWCCHACGGLYAFPPDPEGGRRA